MQVPTVPPLDGVDDLYSLLAFLTDPEAVEKRLVAMEKVRDEINAMVEKVGKASDIDRLLIQADTDRKLAREALDAAKDEARQVRDAADQYAAQTHQAADDYARDERASIEQRAETLRQNAMAHQQRLAEYRTMEQSLKEHQAKVAVREAEATVLRDEYTQKLGKLKAAGIV